MLIMKNLFYSLLLSLCFGKSENSTGLIHSAKISPYAQPNMAVTYYVHPQLGDDANAGTSKQHPFKTLQRLAQVSLHPGDTIALAANQTYNGSLQLMNQQGNEKMPIVITSIGWDEKNITKPATINFKSYANGILIQDCSYITLTNIALTGNGYEGENPAGNMRCGVLVSDANAEKMTGIQLSKLSIHDVYFENPGFIRDENEVKSANGTQRYGWGIRLINKSADQVMENIQITDCEIANVSHTGIKLTGSKQNIREVKLLHNTVRYTGGPGMQMSEVQNVYVANNVIDHSGSKEDSRKWGRGSGLWTWGSTNVLIEKNKFLYANGPGDSDGAHIDFNCTNIVIQYNFSAYNAGGFCEILGNNYNCIYQYNISVNDGYRVKGKNGAFQEGKTLWLSGFQGNNQKRKGPVNTYICNNTIYADSSILPKVAFDNTSEEVLIANNIFCIAHPFQMVLGDQYKSDVKNNQLIKNMELRNNLFLKPDSWPVELMPYEKNTFTGDPQFKNPGGLNWDDYIPSNAMSIKNKGIPLPAIQLQLKDFPYTIQPVKDIFGKPVSAQPAIGAIEP